MILLGRIGACKVYGKDETGWIVELNHSNPIGEYSTGEKAIKVLDRICDAYARFRGGNVYECSTYQMPQESEVNKMKACRYDKDANTEGCPGCELGCLDHRPAAYINREFEDAVKEMESDGRCRRNKNSKS